jgi:hypothetical protein
VKKERGKRKREEKEGRERGGKEGKKKGVRKRGKKMGGWGWGVEGRVEGGGRRVEREEREERGKKYRKIMNVWKRIPIAHVTRDCLTHQFASTPWA